LKHCCGTLKLCYPTLQQCFEASTINVSLEIVAEFDVFAQSFNVSSSALAETFNVFPQKFDVSIEFDLNFNVSMQIQSISYCFRVFFIQFPVKIDKIKLLLHSLTSPPHKPTKSTSKPHQTSNLPSLPLPQKSQSSWRLKCRRTTTTRWA
jgi:hypothetical protein